MRHNETVMLPINELMDFEAQPFKVLDDDSMYELAESIKEHGLIQPLTVRKIHNGSKFSHFQYELIAGERRLRASKLLDMAYIPCIIMEIDSKISAELAISAALLPR